MTPLNRMLDPVQWCHLSLSGIMEAVEKPFNKGNGEKQEEYMPLWDSVQRSLEKASQEAARIAKTQRLRSIIDGLNRQINTQHSSIVNKAMDMFVSGQLTTAQLYH